MLESSHLESQNKVQVSASPELHASQTLESSEAGIGDVAKLSTSKSGPPHTGQLQLRYRQLWHTAFSAVRLAVLLEGTNFNVSGSWVPFYAQAVALGPTALNGALQLTRRINILSLDDGGVRGLSMLFSLKRLMELIDSKNPPKPCDYFDMIGGVGTGG
jgi:hypothetical protein